MRRRNIHLLFGAAALVFAALAAQQALQCWQAARSNRAVAAASANPGAVDSAATGMPQVRLARANALAATGRAADGDAAIAIYNGLIQAGPPGQPEQSGQSVVPGAPAAGDAVAQTALFNLGNLLLRKGRASADGDAFAAQALLELAKQRYRELLRAQPLHWDARYNLERALWLAPEAQDMFGAETDAMPKEILQFKLPGMPPGDLP